MPKRGFKQSDEHKEKHLIKILGENNGNYKHGLWKSNKREYQRLWKQKNPEKMRIANNRHNLKRRGLLVGSFTIGEWELLKKQYGYTCPCCKKQEPEIKLTIDHIIPVTKGGSNYIENIQPLCMPCNSKKRTEIIKYEL